MGAETGGSHGATPKVRRLTGELAQPGRADLNGLVQEGTEAVGFRDRIAAPGFEQVSGQVAQGALVVFDGGLALAIALEDRAEDMRDLEQEVKVFGGVGVLGAGVLHLEPGVFLLRPRKAVVGRAATARRPGGARHTAAWRTLSESLRFQCARVGGLLAVKGPGRVCG